MKKLLYRKGASAVEFALILPLLMVIVFGIIEFSFILFDKQIITNASREGARAGIVAQSHRLTDAQITAVVNTYISTYLVSFASVKATATTTVVRAGSNFENPLTVTVTYPYTFLVLPNFISAISGVKTITATTVMNME